MAHFAKINDENEVINVLYVDNDNIQNDQNIETESVGQTYLQTHNNWPADKWIQCSYNTVTNTHKSGGSPFRGNYPSIGFTWDSTNNIFWPPKPFASWVKHIESAQWKSPIGDAPALTDEENSSGKYYEWNETNQTWDLKTPT